MQLIDNVMTNPLIGAYIGFTSLILVNIFIAILTNTVNRVWEKAVAYVVLQRALVIVSQEKAWHQDQHKDHAKYLRDKCCPYIDETYHEIITSADDKINSLEEELKEQRKTLKEMSNSLDEAVRCRKHCFIIYTHVIFTFFFYSTACCTKKGNKI